METIGKIRRWRRVENLSISDIARRLGVSRNTIKKYLKSEVTRPRYKQREKRYPVIGPWVSRLALLLAQDYSKPAPERRSGTLRRDCLDHVIALNECHLRRIMARYLDARHAASQ